MPIVSWLYEGVRAILEMLFSKRFLVAEGIKKTLNCYVFNFF